VVTDQHLSDLFTEGTAPERDPAFALQVAAAIGRARVRRRLLALGLRVTVLLVLAVPVFVASRLIAPVLAHLVEGVPQFMGVPVPTVVLGVLVTGLVLLRARLSVLFRRFAPSSS
jgi:hypothetical protein